jgi:hypothetical protein
VNDLRNRKRRLRYESDTVAPSAERRLTRSAGLGCCTESHAFAFSRTSLSFRFGLHGESVPGGSDFATLSLPRRISDARHGMVAGKGKLLGDTREICPVFFSQVRPSEDLFDSQNKLITRGAILCRKLLIPVGIKEPGLVVPYTNNLAGIKDRAGHRMGVAGSVPPAGITDDRRIFASQPRNTPADFVE